MSMGGNIRLLPVRRGVERMALDARAVWVMWALMGEGGRLHSCSPC